MLLLNEYAHGIATWLFVSAMWLFYIIKWLTNTTNDFII